MAQLVTRVSEELACQLDELVARHVVASRSDAVRVGLERLIEQDRRRQIGAAIVEGYRREPQAADDIGWPDAATAEMIAEESW